MSNAKSNVLSFIPPTREELKDKQKESALPVQVNDNVMGFRHQSVFLLVKYTAFFLDMSYEYVESLVKKRFAVDDLGKLLLSEHEDVVQYLLDLQEDKVVVTMH